MSHIKELIITQYDYLTDLEEKAFYRDFIKDDNSLEYQEVETDAKKKKKKIKNGIHIYRICDTITDIELILNEEGEAKLSSEYGEMVFNTKLIKLIEENNKVIVEYQLLNNDIIAHKKYIWKIKEI